MAETTLITRDKGRPGQRPRITAEDMTLIARLHRSGRKITEIARLVSTPERSITPQAIGQWLRRASTPAEDLHRVLASMRASAIDSWGQAMTRGARDGRHAPAKDLLIATGTIRNDAQPALVVVIGSGSVDVDTLPSLPRRD